jgi:hypothetical protein
VDIRELPAAIVSFQRHQPDFPPTQIVNSAPSSLTAASHFSGKYAKSAKIANFVQILLLFLGAFGVKTWLFRS